MLMHIGYKQMRVTDVDRLRCVVTITLLVNFTSVTWKRGDVLIIDNLKIAHSGMPGVGPRDLKVVMCNCGPISCTPAAPGVYARAADDVRESLGALLRDGPPWNGGSPNEARVTPLRSQATLLVIKP
jgi:hypothetical protein